MRWILITTTRKGEDKFDLVRLRASIGKARLQEGGTYSITHVVLHQASARSDEIIGENGDVDLFHPGLLSLSDARNYSLAWLASQTAPSLAFDNDCVIAFPDDDCWYPAGLIAGVSQIFEAGKVDLFLCRYGDAPDDTTLHLSPVRATSLTVARYTSSITIFVRGVISMRVGEFDPHLGLGTAAISGEDLDYALRAFNESRVSVFSDRVLVGHRSPSREKRVTYLRGSSVAVAQNVCWRTRGLLGTLLKKGAASLVYLARRQMTVGDAAAIWHEVLRILLKRTRRAAWRVASFRLPLQ